MPSVEGTDLVNTVVADTTSLLRSIVDSLAECTHLDQHSLNINQCNHNFAAAAARCSHHCYYTEEGHR